MAEKQVKQEEEKVNTPVGLAAKKVAIMGELQTITKRGHNQHGKFDYATADDVSLEFRRLFAKHGISLSAKMVDSKVEEFDKYINVVCKFIYVLIDAESDETEEHPWEASANAKLSADKARNIAATNGLKYWLKSEFLLDTGDEGDSDTGVVDTRTKGAEPISYKTVLGILDLAAKAWPQENKESDLCGFVSQKAKSTFEQLTEVEGERIVALIDKKLAGD